MIKRVAQLAAKLEQDAEGVVGNGEAAWEHPRTMPLMATMQVAWLTAIAYQLERIADALEQKS